MGKITHGVNCQHDRISTWRRSLHIYGSIKRRKEAAEFYAALIPNSKIKNTTALHNTPSGDCAVVSFELCGQPFMAISAGPLFTFNPSVSFHVKCETKGDVDAIWEGLSQGGKVLMPLEAYPFSERYGWVEDKYGLSWQLILVEGARGQKITPVLMFVGSVCGKTEAAINFYTSVFKNSPSGAKTAAVTKADVLARYGKGEEPNREGTVKYASFTLLGLSQIGGFRRVRMLLKISHEAH